jgi:putative tricarboxylic transport membrane protein
MAIRALPVTSFCFLFLGAAYLAGSLELPRGSAAQPGAGLYPLLLGVFLLTLSLTLLIRSLRKNKTKPEEGEPFPEGKDRQRVMAVGIALFLFVLFLKPLGYGLCSAVLMGVILRLLGLASWGKIALISILTALLSYYLFASLLGVPLPGGIFFS